MGGKSLKRAWSAEEIEKRLRRLEEKEGREEERRTRSLLDILGGRKSEEAESE